MSESWDPWQLESNDTTIAPPIRLAQSLFRQANNPNPANPKNDLTKHEGFISFLALAQKLQLDFFPITWYPGIETVGAGATAEIRQALINIQTSIAFKRIHLVRDSAFRALSSEISVLGHPVVRQHENIVTLEGICWDINPEGTVVWPVLVFQKSPCGNLEEFVQSESGRTFSVPQKLSLLREIARGLHCLHKCNIIHGDIKPNNILVFKSDVDGYTAKVADLGYATLVANDSFLQVAISEPWTDPGYHGEWLDLSTAKKLDSYSFGLVCAWLLQDTSSLSTRQFHNSEKETSEMMWNMVGRHDLFEILKLLNEISGISDQQKLDIEELFRSTLEPSIDHRSSNFLRFLELLGESMISTLSIPDLYISEDFKEPEPEFRVSKNLFRLLKADFRLPNFITAELRQQYDELVEGPIKSNAAFQLSLCYAIGFGGRRDTDASAIWLARSGKKSEDLELEIEMISLENTWPFLGTTAKSLEMNGALEQLDARLLQDAAKIVERAERYYLELIDDLGMVFDQGHSVIILSKFLLASVLNKAGSYRKAEDIVIELSKTMEKIPGYGPLHRSTLAVYAEVAAMSFKLGKYANAEDSFRKSLEGQKEILGFEHPETLKSLDGLSLVLENQGRYQNAEELSRTALETRKRIFGEDHPETLSSMSGLANILVGQGNYTEAEAVLVNVVSRRQQIFGKGNADTLIAMSNLAAIYNLQGKLADAERLAQEVRHEMEETLGDTHPDTFYLLGNLASTMHALGKNKMATEMCNLLLERRDTIGPDNPYNLTVMSNLSLILSEEGRYDESLQIDYDLLERRTTIFGADHPDTLLTMNSIAATLQRKGNFTEAKAMYESVLHGRQNELGEFHPKTLQTSCNLAYLFQQMGDFTQAMALHKKTLEQLETKLGPLHPSTLMSMNNLGVFFLLLGDVPAALDIGRRALEGRLKLLGDEHPDTLMSMDNVAVALENVGQSEEAEKYFRHELQQEHRLGEDHLIILAARNNYGMMLYTLNRLEEAKDCITKALDGRRRVLGEEHPETLSALYNMALVNFKEHQYESSIEGLRFVAEKRSQNFGDDHHETLRALSNLATVLGHDGQYAKAEQLHRQIFNLRSQKLGDDHLDTLATSRSLALALRDQGKLNDAEDILARLVITRRQKQGEEHPQTLHDRYTLSLLKGDQGKYQEAELELRDILKHRETALGLDHAETLNAANLLGLMVRNQGKHEEASNLFQRALEGRRKLPGGEKAVFETMGLQALVCQDRGDLDSAKHLNESALEGWESLLGPDHPHTLATASNLAAVFLEMGDKPNAKRLYQRILTGREKTLGPLHPATLESTRELAIICYLDEPTEEALPLMQRAYDGYCRLLGPEDAKSKECEEDLILIRGEVESS